MAGGSPSDWKFLDDVLTSLANKVRDGAAVIPLPGPTPEEARAYLVQLQARFDALEGFVATALEHPIAYDVGKEVGHLISVAAKRAAKVSREVAEDLAENFEKTADRLAAGGESVAKGIGLGMGVALVLLLIFLARKA